jgi:hypothetical protein
MQCAPTQFTEAGTCMGLGVGSELAQLVKQQISSSKVACIERNFHPRINDVEPVRQLHPRQALWINEPAEQLTEQEGDRAHISWH